MFASAEEDSLFQAFRWWGAVRSKKEREKNKSEGEGEVSPVPLYFLSLSLLRTALHYLNAWNRL